MKPVLPLLSCLLLLWGVPVALADDLGETAPPDEPDGREIYERVIANRFRSFSQDSKLVSADRSGRTQESRFLMKWKDFRTDGDERNGKIVSKTLVKYTHPFDLRHSGYLIQANEGRGVDQFVYYPSRRRIVRVNLRNEAVYGTDFSFEDVVPREAQEFDYERLEDATWKDTLVYVVELRPKPFTRSEYSKIEVYVDQARSVVVHAHYWDEAGVEVKRFSAPPSRVKEFDGVFIPMESTMVNVLLETYTKLLIQELVPNPDFSTTTFDLGRLETH